MAPRIRRSRSTASFALVACALGMAGSGCDRASGASSSACSAPTPAVVTRVVFIGKKEACDCTRKAIDAGLKSLETTLAAGHAMPVEKLDVDADPDQVNTYRLMKPFVALPAIYFLDVNEGLVELLQGEVSEAQVQTVLR
jgi:hypothetical protein